MFYRYNTGGGTWERLNIKKINPPKPLYIHNLVQLNDEIVLDPPWPHCQMFRLKKATSDMFPDIMLGDGCGDVPDILTNRIPIVSEKVKNIIQEMDDFEHQFAPLSFFNRDGELLDKGKYYYFHMRRRLKFELLGFQPQAFFRTGTGTKFIGTIQNVPGLREKVETLPIWTAGSDFGVLYMNEELVSRFKQENLKCFEEYSTYDGWDEESLCDV